MDSQAMQEQIHSDESDFSKRRAENYHRNIENIFNRKQTGYVNRNVSSLFASCLSKKQIGDCQIFTKQNYVLALIREPDIEKLRKILETFAKEKQLYVSLSRSFSPLTKLPSQYENTEQLLKMGVSFSPKTYFYCNADYGLYMIMDELLKKHAITELCHALHDAHLAARMQRHS